MDSISKLKRYEAALTKWHKAQETNDPLVHKPTRQEFDIRTVAECWLAGIVEKNLCTKTCEQLDNKNS